MFSITTHYNSNLYLGQDMTRVVLSLGVAEDVPLAPAPLALAIVLDCSGSMSGDKIQAACNGAARIIRVLDEHVVFMVVGFHDRAEIIYGPVACTAEHKQRALKAIKRLHATNGTRMSTALRAVVGAFRPYQEQAKKILFLTDGKNEGEKRSALNQAVDLCVQARIGIQAWGVGADWDATELRHMAEVTHGSADIIPNPKQIEEAFLSSFDLMRRTALTDVRLVLWTPVEVAVKQIQQVYPTIVALSHDKSGSYQQDSANPRQQLVSLGSFAAGDRRDYLIDITLATHEPGQQYMALRPAVRYVSVGAGEQEERAPRESWVAIQWTNNASLAAQIDPHIAHYTDEKDLAEGIQKGNEALARGDKQQAAMILAQALEMSQRTGNEKITKLLSTIVLRRADGTVQLKDVDAITRKTLEIKQGSTSRIS